MTTTTGSHYRFRHAARMEWVKLRSLRSTWWTLAVTIAAAAARTPWPATRIRSTCRTQPSPAWPMRWVSSKT